MYLKMQQKRFSLKQDFAVYDQNEKEIYQVEGKSWSGGLYLRIIDSQMQAELATVQKLSSKIFEYEIGIFEEEEEIFRVKQGRLGTFISQSYDIIGKNWQFSEGEHRLAFNVIDGQNNILMKVVKESRLIHEIEVDEAQMNPIHALGIVLAQRMIQDMDQE